MLDLLDRRQFGGHIAPNLLVAGGLGQVRGMVLRQWFQPHPTSFQCDWLDVHHIPSQYQEPRYRSGLWFSVLGSWFSIYGQRIGVPRAARRIQAVVEPLS